MCCGLIAAVRRQARPARALAPPFQQNHIVPDTIEMAEALSNADLAETAFGVQRSAGVVLSQDLHLQGPVSLRFRGCDQAFEKPRADPFPLR